MGKGGYLIVDVSYLGDILEVAKQAEKGLYDRIKNADVPIMFYRATVNGVDVPSQFVIPTIEVDNINFVLRPSGVTIYIKNDDTVYTSR